MTCYVGTIELDVADDLYDEVVELARDLDESAALFEDDDSPTVNPPIRLCLSVIANHSEGLDRLISGRGGKVGWSITFPEQT